MKPILILTWINNLFYNKYIIMNYIIIYITYFI